MPAWWLQLQRMILKRRLSRHIKVNFKFSIRTAFIADLENKIFFYSYLYVFLKLDTAITRKNKTKSEIERRLLKSSPKFNEHETLVQCKQTQFTKLGI